MRLAFRASPWDLYLAVALGAALLPLLALRVGGAVGIAAAVVTILFLPGYALVAALFPGTGEIDPLRRVTLSVVVSLAAVPPAGLLANATPWGIRVEAILAILAAVTLGGAFVAYLRRVRLPVERRLRLSIELSLPRWGSLSSPERALIVVLGLCVAVAAGGFAVSWGPAEPPGFTEFGLLNESGYPGGYPHDLAVGEEGRVILLVVSHESRPVAYSIRVRLATLVWTFNETTFRNESTEVSSVDIETLTLSLEAGEERRLPYAFTVAQPGDYALRFLLFKGPVNSGPYQEISLLVTVT